MILRNKNVSQSWYLLFILLIQQIIARITLPELRELASRLKPTECLKIISDDLDSSVKKTDATTIHNEKECYKKLVDWAVRLKLTQEKTNLLLKYRLNEVGRKDLSRWLTRPKSVARKAIRNAKSPDYSEIRMDNVKETNRQSMTGKRKRFLSSMDNSFEIQDSFSSYQDPKSKLVAKLDKLLDLKDENTSSPSVNENAVEYDNDDTTTAKVKKGKEAKEDLKNGVKEEKTSTQENPSETEGIHSVKLSLRITSIIIIVTVIVTCCCTLFLRNKLLNVGKIFRRKKTKGKFISVDEIDEIKPTPRRRSLLAKKPIRKKRKRAPSFEIVQPLAQATQTIEPADQSPEPPSPFPEPEETTPTGCCRCYKKRRKKRTKKSKK